MRKVIAPLLVLLTSLYGCSSKRVVFEVTDLSRDTTFIATTNKQFPSFIILKVSGQASDTFLLQGFVKIPGGKINEEIQQDCYHQEYNIRYSPYLVSSCKLQIIYVVP